MYVRRVLMLAAMYLHRVRNPLAAYCGSSPTTHLLITSKGRKKSQDPSSDQHQTGATPLSYRYNPTIPDSQLESGPQFASSHPTIHSHPTKVKVLLTPPTGAHHRPRYQNFSPPSLISRSLSFSIPALPIFLVSSSSPTYTNLSKPAVSHQHRVFPILVHILSPNKHTAQKIFQDGPVSSSRFPPHGCEP